MTTEQAEPTSLAEAILFVREQVAYVQKQRGKELNYTYANIESVIREVRHSMNVARLVFVPTKSTILEGLSYQTAKGGTMHRVRLAVSYQMIHAPSKEEVTIEAIGEAADSGDKAVNKCYAAALKLALLQAFLLERGDMDPDEHYNRFGNGHADVEEPEWWSDFVESLKAVNRGDDVRKYCKAAYERRPPVAYVDRLNELQEEHLRRVGALAPGK